MGKEVTLRSPQVCRLAGSAVGRITRTDHLMTSLWRKYQLTQAEKGCKLEMDACTKCEAKYGKGAQPCLMLILEEKRCLSEDLCPQEAARWYNSVCPALARGGERKQKMGKMQKALCREAAYSLARCTHT